MKVFGFAGYSGSGKTTLIEQLIPRLVQRGLRVSLIKHAHHTFDVDRPGKDSYRHRHAGASEVLVTSSRRWVLMHELRGAQEPSFEEQLKHLSPCDLLIVEGFKHAPIPKLEVWRALTGDGLLHPPDPPIVALAEAGHEHKLALSAGCNGVVDAPAAIAARGPALMGPGTRAAPPPAVRRRGPERRDARPARDDRRGPQVRSAAGHGDAVLRRAGPAAAAGRPGQRGHGHAPPAVGRRRSAPA